jgi:4-aminobutyrate aminotransferase-like enzyme
MTPEEILKFREKHLGKSLSVSYRQPLKIVRGSMQYLYGENGREYLDCVNNVCHVGHCHPQVVQVAYRQMATLNTNTRYLHDHLVNYARRLAATLPPPLTVCYFVCSGSEANELALRIARAHTGRKDVVVLEAGYHGNTASLIDLSPYKHKGAGGYPTPPHVHVAPLPDRYRGAYRYGEPDAGARYAETVRDMLIEMNRQGRDAGAFIAESLASCAGQVELAPGYLKAAYRHVREAGGVCIADEVQVGFGRIGSHFWGFETHDVVPDIVSMGKPIGNGHPMAAVVTTPALADSFANGMEYFNTFGGNPVSCAVGLSVLDILTNEGLQQHAWFVGSRLKKNLQALQAHHALIGDVRGRGLFLGVELVRNRTTLEPAAGEAAAVVERMKDRGILLSTDGPLHNVIKLKPPLPFNDEDGDRVIETLDDVLRAL